MRCLATLLLAIALFLPFAAHGQDKDKKKDDGCEIIYVPTEQDVVEKMLEMAKVK